MILKFKNGSGIHIKKKNRGKFTSYCGGNVTSACIARAKASGNPTLVKRATFAANARKWKHQKGGILKALYGNSLNLSSEDILGGLDLLGKGLGKVWDTLNYNITGNPDIITGAPEWLPGRVGMMEKEAPTIYKMIVENGKNIKNSRYWNKIKDGNSWKSVYDSLKDFFKTGDRNILINIENWAKLNKNIFVDKSYYEPPTSRGFIKGNEVTPVSKYPISEEGLTARSTKLKNRKKLMNSNPITDEGSLQAAKDWVQMMGELGVFPTKAPKVTNVEVTVPVHNPLVKNEFTSNLIKAVERRQDNAIPITKKVKTSVKHALSFDDMDLRHILSGRKKFTKPQRERAQYLITNHYNSSNYGPWHKNLLNSYKKEAKIDRMDKKAWDKMMKARYEILDDFIKNSGLF